MQWRHPRTQPGRSNGILHIRQKRKRWASKHQSSRVEATLIPGDGIGPEIAEAVQIVLDALG
jgi:hypothetical protein